MLPDRPRMGTALLVLMGTVVLFESPDPIGEYWIVMLSGGVVRGQIGHLFISVCQEGMGLVCQ